LAGALSAERGSDASYIDIASPPMFRSSEQKLLF
jgi:hypothetical protein